MEDAEKDRFRKLVNRYIRQYGFIAQVMTFVDPDLEKYYVFLKVLYKYLPYTKETLPVDILEHIDLDKLRIQLSFEGQLELEDEEKELSASRIGEPGKKKPDEEKIKSRSRPSRGSSRGGPRTSSRPRRSSSRSRTSAPT